MALAKSLAMTKTAVLFGAFLIASTGEILGAAEESPMAAAIDDGARIVARKKSVQKKMEEERGIRDKLRQEVKAHGDDPATHRAADFNSRCHRAFSQAEAAAYHACVAEREQNKDTFEVVEKRAANLDQRVQRATSNRASLEAENRELDTQFKHWERRVKALAIAANLGGCDVDQSASAEERVNRYQQCWDRARGAIAPPTKGKGLRITPNQ